MRISLLFKSLYKALINSPLFSYQKKRLFIISLVSVIIGAFISLVAKLLVSLIYLFTNISFFGKVSIEKVNPANNELGPLVIIVPVIGGLIVGVMARYGSKAIRGHGIPEAMEQILTNQSKIHPSLAWLKPLSSAISIGTGGPFGAEGPIIATGGALGSTIGQLIRITGHERKILLAAGATAGMSAIFGTPFAAIFLAIELLLFEFSARSIIPVALACITGAAGHRFLFEPGPVFPSPVISSPGNMALFFYSLFGLLTGIASVFVTKAVYFIEDSFEKLPVHWALWPAIGGIVVGITGYYAPRTLGVGYENITDLLSGNLAFKAVVFLCAFKFISWSVALGSGTSGGTLAPLLTIGGAWGVLLGTATVKLFPDCGVILPLAAMIGMSAMFAGASRALLTSIIFILEASGAFNALLPLLAACSAAYIVSFFFIENTIMTEKIARRGINTPDNYEPDLLERLCVKDIMNHQPVLVSVENSIGEVREWFNEQKDNSLTHLVLVDTSGRLSGILNCMDMYANSIDIDDSVSLLNPGGGYSVTPEMSLKRAIGMMSDLQTEVLPVVKGSNDQTVVGVVSFRNVINAYQTQQEEHHVYTRNISLKRRGIKILLHGKKLISMLN